MKLFYILILATRLSIYDERRNIGNQRWARVLYSFKDYWKFYLFL